MRNNMMILCAIMSATSVVAQSQGENREPIRLIQARSAYESRIKSATDPIRQQYTAQLEAIKRDLGAIGDATGAMAAQQEINRISQEGRSGTAAVIATHNSKLVIWNQHNDFYADRGTKRCNIICYKKGSVVWRTNNVETAWKADADEQTVVMLPDVYFDKIRIAITEWYGQGGGLAEIEVIKNDKNLVRGLPAQASGVLQDKPVYNAEHITDGITYSKPSGGFWLLPDNQAGWIEINMNEIRAEPGARAYR
jgi:hypothetical protein